MVNINKYISEKLNESQTVRYYNYIDSHGSKRLTCSGPLDVFITPKMSALTRNVKGEYGNTLYTYIKEISNNNSNDTMIMIYYDTYNQTWGAEVTSEQAEDKLYNDRRTEKILKQSSSEFTVDKFKDIYSL